MTLDTPAGTPELQTDPHRAHCLAEIRERRINYRICQPVVCGMTKFSVLRKGYDAKDGIAERLLNFRTRLDSSLEIFPQEGKQQPAAQS